jgi:methyl-accepting chemotaxis protein
MFVSVWKRRIIVGKFQYRLLTGNLLYLTSVALVFFVVLFGPVVAVLGDATLTASEREIAAHELLVLHERVWFALPALIALCILHSVVVSHRIAGPLHRFKTILAGVAQGNLSMKTDVRRHDYLTQEAEVLSAAVESLRERVRRIERGQRQASATLPQLIDAVGRGASKDSAVLAGKLGTQLDALGKQIRQFRLPETDGSGPQAEQVAPAREPVAAG